MRRKRTRSLRDRALGWLAALLLAAGAVVLLYPAQSNLYYQRQYAQAAETFAQGQSEAENAALWQAAEAYNMALAEKAEQFALTAEEAGDLAAYWRFRDPLRHHGSHWTDESKALYGP